jgi:hypothetical protein
MGSGYENVAEYSNEIVFVKLCSYTTSFPGLSYEEEGRDEKALVRAGHVTTQKMAVFDSYLSRSGEMFFNEYTSLRNK